MTNGSSLSGLLTSICHCSFAICHLTENPCQIAKDLRVSSTDKHGSLLRVFVVKAGYQTTTKTRRIAKRCLHFVRFAQRSRDLRQPPGQLLPFRSTAQRSRGLSQRFRPASCDPEQRWPFSTRS